MKAVIVDLNGTDAVALRDDGQFVKMKNKNYTIGQELTIQSQIIRFPKQAAVAASAAIVIAACGGMGSYTWSNPISYVSLDINPSIAYSLNEFNRVIAVDGMNDEGAAIVDAIGDSLKNTDITTALTITVEQLSTDAYIDADNTNYMIIGVYSDKDSKADALMSTVDEFTANSVETCSITTVNVSKETKESADSYGITAGKMELINEIASVATDPKEVDPAVLADLTVAELEQTKTAAASGTPVNEAVAAATPDPDESDVPEIPVDPNAIASDSKPADDSVSTASAKKDESDTDTAPEDDSSASNVAPTTPAGASTAASDKATGSSTNSGSGSASDTGSTDKNGNGSSEKKDESVSSPSKGETTSSEKKDESGSSSSEKKDSSTSSEKKDEVTEDSSQQTNSNLDVELPVELPDEFPEEFPVTDEDGSIVVCSMAV
ncbi:MAG: hypothetical protein ACI4EE_12680 [Lachnospiraceae bacterium]